MIQDLLNQSPSTHQELKTLVESFYISTGEKKDKLRDEIFTKCIRFIRKKTLTAIKGRREFYDDVFQSACVGFLCGLERFDPSRNVPFLTYADFWIINFIRKEFYSRNIINISPKFYKKDSFVKLRNSALSYYDNMLDKDEIKEHYYLVDKDSLDFEMQLHNTDTMDKLIHVADEYFGPTEKLVFELKYLNDQDIKDGEIAEVLGVTRQAVESTTYVIVRKFKSYLKTGRMKKTIISKKVEYDNKSILKLILNRRENELVCD